MVANDAFDPTPREPWYARHWLKLFSGVLAVYVILPILAPVFMLAGWRGPAGVIYRVYSPMCHQMAFRSFFIGGPQPVYPLSLAEPPDNQNAFEDVVRDVPLFASLSPNDDTWGGFFLAARQYLGSFELGFKTALCQRDLGIFGFLLIGTLLYGLVGRRWRIGPMPLWAFLLIGMGPIALDGFSQLFGYYGISLPILDIFALRESPPYLRFGTGAWFGFAVAWLAVPHLDRSFRGDP